MKILLIRPSLIVVETISRSFATEPLAPRLLASIVPDHDVEILDLYLYSDQDTLQQRLERFNPDVVGVTCPSVCSIYDAQNVLKEVKQYNDRIFTVVGGNGPTHCPEEFNKEYVNFIVIGEGDYTFRELIQALEEKRDVSGIKGLCYRENGRLAATEKRQFIDDLSALPVSRMSIPGHDLTKYNDVGFIKGNSLTIYTSRGCDCRCDYCSAWFTYGPRIRYLPAERVVEEIEQIDLPAISTHDCNFFHNRERFAKICSLMKDKGIHKKWFFQTIRAESIDKVHDLLPQYRKFADNIMIFVLAEAVDDYYLKRYKKLSSAKDNDETFKILFDEGYLCLCNFQVDPEFSEADFDKMIDYIDKHPIVPKFTMYTPLPATDMYKQRINDITTKNLKKYDCAHLVLPTKLPLEKFKEKYKELFTFGHERSLDFLLNKVTVGDLNDKFVSWFSEGKYGQKTEMLFEV